MQVFHASLCPLGHGCYTENSEVTRESGNTRYSVSGFIYGSEYTVPGDINGDGKINIAEAIYALQTVSGKIGLDAIIYALQTVSGIISRNLNGIFYNIKVEAGGSVTLNGAIFQADSVSGFMDFTQRLEDPRPLCGAGNLNGTITANKINATFISADTDNGCGFDHNSIFTITGTHESDKSHFWGDYAPKNSDGSNITEDAGVFEIWSADQKPKNLSFEGTFLNTNANLDGNVLMDISIGKYTVSGYMNFSNRPGEEVLCGAGYFTGVIYPDKTMQLSFISDDKDNGCDFGKGDRFIIDASLSDDADTITGIYRIDSYPLGNFTIS